MDSQDENCAFFWINGKVTNISTLEDFTDVGGDDVIRSLIGSGSQWGSVLTRSLCHFVIDMYLARDYANNKIEKYENQSPNNFEEQIRDLYTILQIVISEPLAVWVTNRDELAAGMDEYALPNDPIFAQILNLSHIHNVIFECCDENRDLLRRIRTLEADYNKRRKALRRKSGSEALIKGCGLTLGKFAIWTPPELPDLR